MWFCISSYLVCPTTVKWEGGGNPRQAKCVVLQQCIASLSNYKALSRKANLNTETKCVVLQQCITSLSNYKALSQKANLNTETKCVVLQQCIASLFNYKALSQKANLNTEAKCVVLLQCIASLSNYKALSQKANLNTETKCVVLQQCIASLPSNSAVAKYKQSIEDNFKAVKLVMSDDQQDQPVPDQLREWSVDSLLVPLFLVWSDVIVMVS